MCGYAGTRGFREDLITQHSPPVSKQSNGHSSSQSNGHSPGHHEASSSSEASPTKSNASSQTKVEYNPENLYSAKFGILEILF